jgi:hypothetical protein
MNDMAVSKKRKIAGFIIATLALIVLATVPVTAGSFAVWASMDSGAASDLHGIWGSNDTDVFAVGSSGTIVHYDGSKWSLMSSGITNDLYSVWGTDGRHVFAVGSFGTIIHYDGSQWSLMSGGITNDLYGIWGTDGRHVFAVGSSGTIMRYDGSTWSLMGTGTSSDFSSIWGVTSANVFAVGKSGTIAHYDGSSWSPMNSGNTDDLNSVWGAEGNAIFSAGDSGTILSYDGSEWRSMSSGTTGDLYGLWGADRANVFVVGESGTIAYYDGSKWSSRNRNTINKLSAVWGLSAGEVFAAGGSGTILRYLPPVIKSISSDRGNQGETLDITLTGENLSGASEVRLGAGIAVNSFTVVNSKQIAANITIVAGAETGARDVLVIAEGGTFTLPNSFTVEQALPTITLVSPEQDRQAATLKVTITGTNLSGAIEVRLGAGIAINSFTVISANQISADITISADAETGARNVSVATAGGSFTLPNSFTVKQALPTITSISTDQGNQETKLSVTIDGTNLSGASDLRFGAGIAVNSFTILSSNQIAVGISISAGAPEGARDVTVTTPGGGFTLPNSFTVKQALPEITSVTPNHGNQGAMLNVAISGTNFGGASELRLGTGIAVYSFTVLSSNRIEATITIVAGAPVGARDVTIATPGGSFALPNGFAVEPGLPTITSISPSEGSQGAALTVIISGSNLDGAASVTFGTGVNIQSFTNLSPTQLSVNVVIDAEAVTGVRDVSITTSGGSSTLGNSFNIKEKSNATLFLALLWVAIAIAVGLFIFILSRLRKNRGAKV